MRKPTILSSLVLSLLIIADPAGAILIGGVEFPDGAASFADAVVSYSVGPGVSSLYADPAEALGVPEGSVSTGFVSLGYSGVLILQFTDNYLTTSFDSSNDLWIFEVGATEPTSVAVSTNGMDWIDTGAVGGGTSGIDIDAYVGSGIVQGEQYSYVRIIDLGTDPTPPGISTYGADIDAVGTISSVPTAPIPEPSTVILVGFGLIGLVGLRRRFRKR